MADSPKEQSEDLAAAKKLSTDDLDQMFTQIDDMLDVIHVKMTLGKAMQPKTDKEVKNA